MLLQNYPGFLVLVFLASSFIAYVNCQNFFYISQIEAGDRHRKGNNGLGSGYYNSANLRSEIHFSTTITLTAFACLTRLLYDK